MSPPNEGPGKGTPGAAEKEQLEALVRLLDEVIFALDSASQATAAAHVDAARSLVIKRLSEGR